MKPVAHILAAEAIGTFAMVFCGTGAIVIDSVTGGTITHMGVAMTFGLVVMAMIYAVGDVSGAHLNPAVTVGFWASGRFKSSMVFPYLLSQSLGGLMASLLLRAIFGNIAFLGATLPHGTDVQSLLMETVLTGLLMFVILCVATGPKEAGILAGIAIGGVIGLEAMFAGPISGASMNPVRSVAPAIISMHVASLWVYVVGPVGGALLAVPFWKMTREPRVILKA